jgi:hypothetical protein
MAPDKIYINGFSAFATEPVKDGIEYIRKDAILEWAKQKQYESLTIVADNFWQEVIDKLNSM